ncbi:MAG TPA: class I SAM-dependent methyltransferase [Ktedonobacterales bacterium]
MNDYVLAEYAQAYLERADRIPHRKEGEAVLLEVAPRSIRRFLDLGTGDGRLIALMKAERPQAHAVGLDFSPAMLGAARERFKHDANIAILEHDLDDPLPALGAFDAVVSSFAIHHCEDARKRTLYEEIFGLLEPGGVFCNLEHVASPTASLHEQFLQAMGGPEDPFNKLLDMETQLRWLREIGFADVDCLWKWRELALLVGYKNEERRNK